MQCSLEFNFRHGECWVSLLDATSIGTFYVSPWSQLPAMMNAEGARSSVDLLCGATGLEGASTKVSFEIDSIIWPKDALPNDSVKKTYKLGPNISRRMAGSGYFVVHDDQGLVTLAPQVNNGLIQMAVPTSASRMVNGLMGCVGTGIWLGELSEQQKTLTPITESYQVIHDWSTSSQLPGFFRGGLHHPFKETTNSWSVMILKWNWFYVT